MNERETLIWAARQLFDHRATPGTTGNLSLLEEGRMLVSPGGACFGTLEEGQLCAMTLDGEALDERRPSKEWPIHAMLHQLRGMNGAVIHTHGFYTTAWSCLPCDNPQDAIPAYTPYLRMKGGAVRWVPYAAPGSQALFEAFRAALDKSAAVYLLAHHGAFVTAPTVMDAFNLIEETEESARMALLLRGTAARTLPL